MKTKLSVLALILFATIGAYDVQARCGQGYGRGALGVGAQGCFPGVTLSQEQIISFNSLRAAFIKETAAINLKLSQKELELQTTLLAPTPDQNKAVALQKELSDLQAEYEASILSYQLKARSMLSQEQSALLPPGCSFGFGNMLSGQRCGYGCGGPGAGLGRGRGQGRGCW